MKVLFYEENIVFEHLIFIIGMKNQLFFHQYTLIALLSIMVLQNSF